MPVSRRQDLATSRFVAASDGLRLHYRDCGPTTSARWPVLCLPGLTRTAEDFDPLASFLSTGGAPRRVLSLDYRGRGLSAHDADPARYSVAVEAADVLAVMADAGIDEAVFVGTSRGGLITMTIASFQPHRIRGTVLNDIGPVLEAAGIERIRSYVGKLPAPRDWVEAVGIVQSYAGQQFTGLSDEDWMAFAKSTFSDRSGALTIRYDPALMRALQDLDTADLPTLWPQFEALRRSPLLVIRGELSDLLSEETADAMVKRHPGGSLVTVAGQGHAPLLRDDPTLARIGAFMLHCDGAHSVPDVGAKTERPSSSQP